MEQILGVITGHLLTLTIVFFVLLIILGTLFARKKIGWALFGIIKSIGSLIYCPFLYIQQRLLSLADFAQKKEIAETDGKQYLLNRFMIFTEAIVVVVSLAILASGLIISWDVFVPPKALRDQIKELETRIDTCDEALALVSPRVDRIENLWTVKKDEYIKMYKARRGKDVIKAENEKKTIEIQYIGDNFLERVNRLLTQRMYYFTKDNIERVKSDAQNFLSSASVNNQQKNKFSRYIDDWYIIKMIELENQRYSEEDYKNTIFPAYSSLKIQSNSLTAELQNSKAQLEYLRPSASYHWGNFLFGLLSALILFIISVWVLGLLMEAMGLGVDVAMNVRDLRKHFENQ